MRAQSIATRGKRALNLPQSIATFGKISRLYQVVPHALQLVVTVRDGLKLLIRHG